jgi:hypothetical protein
MVYSLDLESDIKESIINGGSNNNKTTTIIIIPILTMFWAIITAFICTGNRYIRNIPTH